MSAVVNARFRRQPLTGVQRVAATLVDRLDVAIEEQAPGGPAAGLAGHLWEQVVLPTKVKSRLLWSPSNVGPIAVGRQVLTIHDTAVLDHPEWFKPAFVQTYRAIWRHLSPRVTLVTVSNFSRERLSAHFGRPLSSIHVVPNAAGEAFHPASVEDICEARRAAGLGARPYFLTLSTAEPRKNLPLVIRAWAQARARLPKGVKLAIAGGAGAGNIFANAPSLAGAEDVLILGRLPDSLLPGLISGAWGLIYPSLYEGFGLPIVEAMACGAPAVTTRLASLPEVAGDAAIYVDAEDPDELARAFVDLAGSPDLRAGLKEKGLQRARGFDWDRSAAQMGALLTSLM